MFSLINGWNELSTDYVVNMFLRDAQVCGIYHPVACILTHALLEQLAESRGWKKRANPVVIEQRRFGFKINEALFHVVPQFDDRALNIIPKLARMRKQLKILVPPWSFEAAWNYNASFKGRARVQVEALHSYASLRILNTTLDLKMSHAGAMFRLFWWYNKLAKSTGAGIYTIDFPRLRGYSG
jgi:hypothetical protein